ncbi:hypothetical protein E2320_016110 [Naja naja]|nr:hypothetical protein E2320_016110 [Naja naja]
MAELPGGNGAVSPPVGLPREVREQLAELELELSEVVFKENSNLYIIAAAAFAAAGEETVQACSMVFFCTMFWEEAIMLYCYTGTLSL